MTAYERADRERRLAIICRRTAWRVMPLLLIGYVLNTLAKLNVGFAALSMNKALGLSPAVFGFGAGLFFLTYTAAEVPSNLMMRKIGARRWLARILVTWGVVSMANAFIVGKHSYYVLRLLLGVTEAGWFPGVLFFLALWFPPAFRARATMLFFLGSPIAAVVGAPLSGAILSIPSFHGLATWRWLFIVEGLPSVLLGVLILRLLRDDPEQATWLNPDDKALLADVMSDTAPDSRPQILGCHGRRFVLMVAFFCCCNFCSSIGLYGTFIWIPQVVRMFGGLTDPEIGLLTAIPFAFAAVALVACSYSSDHFKERTVHVVGMFAVASLGFAAAAASHSPAAMLSTITLSKMGLIGVQGAFFALVSDSLRSSHAGKTVLAASLGCVTAIGNLGGFVGPWMIGILVQTYGNFQAAFGALAVLCALESCLVFGMRDRLLAGSRTGPTADDTAALRSGS